MITNLRDDLGLAADDEAIARAEYAHAQRVTRALRGKLFDLERGDNNLPNAVKTTDEAWQTFLKTYRIRDTPEMRLAFCMGALHGISHAVRTFDDGEAMTVFLEILDAFGRGALSVRS
jgi:hypothetical protein